MKTIVLLLALAASAITAPAPSEEKKTHEFRKNKSTTNEVALIDSDLHPLSASGRTVVVQKPIIVKKKIGYHLYRDSEEEQKHTSSRENCMERVKVKLCSENMLPKSMMGSSTPESISEEQMKYSITAAKDEVKILQQDINRLQEKSVRGLLQDSKNDSQIHNDIEIARQAIGHLFKNFHDLKTMGTTENTKLQQEKNLFKTRSEEERLVQWKEAINNIQRNMEIVENIENSFRFSNNNIFSNKNAMNFVENSEDSEDNVNFNINYMTSETKITPDVHKSHDNTLECSMKNQEMLQQTEDHEKNGVERSPTPMVEFKSKDIKDLGSQNSEKQNIKLNQTALDKKSENSVLTNLDTMQRGQFVSIPKVEKSKNASEFEISDDMIDTDMGASSPVMRFLKPNFKQQKISDCENNQESNNKQCSQHNDMRELMKFASDMYQSRIDIEEGRNSIKPVKNINNKETKEANKIRGAHNMRYALRSDDTKHQLLEHSRDTSLKNPQIFAQSMPLDMNRESGHMPSQSFTMSDFIRESPNENDWESRTMHPMSLRDNPGVKPDHILSWKPTHESSTRFGTPVAPVNPVEIYPNANGCSIPLLVSCAPSVVSGSLSKPHPYTAYRSGNEKGFPIKREAKILNEITATADKNKIMNVKAKSTTVTGKQ